MSKECEHGRQADKCETCQLIEAERELEALRAENEKLSGKSGSWDKVKKELDGLRAENKRLKADNPSEPLRDCILDLRTQMAELQEQNINLHGAIAARNRRAESVLETLRAQVAELQSEVERLEDTERTARLHADLNRRAALALGKPQEGPDSSWHDIPERIALLQVNEADLIKEVERLEREKAEAVKLLWAGVHLLDEKLGDTDPIDDLTDDEMCEEYPLVWLCSKFSTYLSTLDTPSKPDYHTLVIDQTPPICEQCGKEMAMLQHPAKPVGVACGYFCPECHPPNEPDVLMSKAKSNKPPCPTCGGSKIVLANDAESFEEELCCPPNRKSCPDCGANPEDGRETEAYPCETCEEGESDGLE